MLGHKFNIHEEDKQEALWTCVEVNWIYQNRLSQVPRGKEDTWRLDALN